MLVLPEELNQASARTCLLALSAALTEEPAAVVLDASSLSRFDSAALAVLLALRRQALKLDKTFFVHGLPQRMADLARLYGISELLPAQA